MLCKMKKKILARPPRCKNSNVGKITGSSNVISVKCHVGTVIIQMPFFPCTTFYVEPATYYTFFLMACIDLKSTQGVNDSLYLQMGTNKN